MCITKELNLKFDFYDLFDEVQEWIFFNETFDCGFLFKEQANTYTQFMINLTTISRVL